MSPLKWLFTYGAKFGLSLVYRIDGSSLARVPNEGPLILFTNHTGYVEAPILYTQLAPRPKVTALAKIELLRIFFFGFVLKVWEVIPVRRGEADREALRACIERLSQGWILGIAPEGTRNKTGELHQAKGGISLLALHSGAPIMPVAHWGGLRLRDHLKRFRRAPFTLKTGEAFRLDAHGEKLTKEIRQEMADEMMYRLAAILPEEYRGAYADLSKASVKWLNFDLDGPVSPAS
ncbi:MAG TPA: lysophospholipid acyltransferase family protein [Rectinemataceae bacterium]|nr:lysophospholipid acyltransferase family protein [Rectinemataceae bacterium]